MKRLYQFSITVLLIVLVVLLMCLISLRAKAVNCENAPEAVEEAAETIEISEDHSKQPSTIYPVYVSLSIDRTYTPLSADVVLAEELDIDETDAAMIAKTCWGEFNDTSRPEQVAAVAWCILNRVDSDDAFFPDTVSGVVRQPSQFLGFHENNPVDSKVYSIVCDVMARWQMEKRCCGSVGRVLPKEIVSFHANSSWTENIYVKPDGSTWDWSLPSPYSR